MNIIGHRGFPVVAPENTLSSFRRAIEAGADMIEFDVTLSHDDVPVVIHDRRVHRTTNGKGWVRRLTFEQLQKLDAGSWFALEFAGEKIPSLEQVLATARNNIAVNVEIKIGALRKRMAAGIEERIIDLLRTYNLQKRSIVSSYAGVGIRRIKELDSRQSTALIMDQRTLGDPRKVLDRAKADALHLHLPSVQRSFVEMMGREGIPVRVFTVNDVRTMKKLKSWGVDGVFTDQVARLVNAMKNDA